MAGDATYELQVAIYARLSGDPTLTSMITGVFDHVPEGTDFPYVTIGDATAADWSSTTHRGQVSTVTVHTWAEAEGRAAALAIMDQVDELLHEQKLSMTGHTMVSMRMEFSETVPDADFVTYHGIQRFRVFTHEGAA